MSCLSLTRSKFERERRACSGSLLSALANGGSVPWRGWTGAAQADTRRGLRGAGVDDDVGDAVGLEREGGALLVGPVVAVGKSPVEESASAEGGEVARLAGIDDLSRFWSADCERLQGVWGEGIAHVVALDAGRGGLGVLHAEGGANVKDALDAAAGAQRVRGRDGHRVLDHGGDAARVGARGLAVDDVRDLDRGRVGRLLAGGGEALALGVALRERGGLGAAGLLSSKSAMVGLEHWLGLNQRRAT